MEKNLRAFCPPWRMKKGLRAVSVFLKRVFRASSLQGKKTFARALCALGLHALRPKKRVRAVSSRGQEKWGREGCTRTLPCKSKKGRVCASPLRKRRKIACATLKKKKKKRFTSALCPPRERKKVARVLCHVKEEKKMVCARHLCHTNMVFYVQSSSRLLWM